MHDRIEKVSDILEKDLKEELDKIANAGTISSDKVKVINDAVCLMLKLREYEEMGYPDNGYSNRSYSSRSYRRGRNMNTGRYMSRDRNGRSSYMDESYDRNSYEHGYSGHSIKDRMIDRLESMYDEAQSEHERQTIDEWIGRLETAK